MSASHLLVECLLDTRVDDAHLGGGVLHVVVDELGVVLGTHAGQIAALGLGNAQTLEGVFDIVGHGVPVCLLVGVGLHVRDDVVHVEAVDARAPGGVGRVVVDLEGFEAALEHPGGLVLALGDLADDVGREAGVEALKALFTV